MKRPKDIAKYFLVVLSLLCTTTLTGQKRKEPNLPFSDYRRLHLGFSLGTHVQDLAFKHSGFETINGELFSVEIPNFSPGFSVGLLGDLMIIPSLNLRFNPSLYFGNKTLHFYDRTHGTLQTQDIRTNYLMLPIMLKYGAVRINNYRPYLITGITGAIDISKKKNDFIRLNTLDAYWEIGFGCDFYLPYFKCAPELKFGFGLTNLLKRNRKDLTNSEDMKYTQSLTSIYGNVVSLTFYFE